jgi:hypothetical protein
MWTSHHNCGTVAVGRRTTEAYATPDLCSLAKEKEAEDVHG